MVGLEMNNSWETGQNEEGQRRGKCILGSGYSIDTCLEAGLDEPSHFLTEALPSSLRTSLQTPPVPLIQHSS